MSHSNLYSLPSFDYPIISIKDLQFGYSSEPVISIQQWELKHGESVFISGVSGSGKTTFVSLLAGLLKPNKGHIVINAKDLTTMKARAINRFRANHMGLISQQFNLIPYLSVMDNIVLAHSFSEKKKTDIQSDALKLLKKLELHEGIADQKALSLSVGQQQRVAIVRALINRPILLIADEPTSALDPVAKAKFMDLLREITQEINLSLIMISHDESLSPFFNNVVSLTELQSHAF